MAIVARDKTALAAAAKEIAGNSGVKVLNISSDTGDDAAVKKMVADVVAAFGRIDILVNCAAQAGGQGKPPSLTEITNEHFWADMNVKVLGYLRTAREVAPHMIKQRSGRIINVSGLAARQTGTIIGSMRNVSVAALTKNLADELAPHGISAVCVHPGLTRTEKTPGVVAAQAKAQGAVGGGDREAHGRAQPGAQDHHRRGDRLRGGLHRLAQGRGAQRRRHRRRRRRSRRDPLLKPARAHSRKRRSDRVWLPSDNKRRTRDASSSRATSLRRMAFAGVTARAAAPPTPRRGGRWLRRCGRASPLGVGAPDRA